jgi:Zn-dependent protease
MLVLAYTACLLNLFNLIPCSPLDGGRIAVAISPHLWWVGSISLAAMFYWTHNILILVIFFFSLARLWQGDKKDGNEKYFQLTLGQRLTVAWWYFGLLAVLGLLALYLVELLH